MQQSLLSINNPPCGKMDNRLKMAAERPSSDLRKIQHEHERSPLMTLGSRHVRWDSLWGGNIFNLFRGGPKTRIKIWQPGLISHWSQGSFDYSSCWRSAQKASRARLAARKGTFLLLNVDASGVLARCSSLLSYLLSFRHWTGGHAYTSIPHKALEARMQTGNNRVYRVKQNITDTTNKTEIKIWQLSFDVHGNITMATPQYWMNVRTHGSD